MGANSFLLDLDAFSEGSFLELYPFSKGLNVQERKQKVRKVTTLVSMAITLVVSVAIFFCNGESISHADQNVIEVIYQVSENKYGILNSVQVWVRVFGVILRIPALRKVYAILLGCTFC